MSRAIGLLALSLVAVIGTLAFTSGERVEAAFPGLNGRIAYSTGGAFPEAVWTASSDGSSATRLVDGGRNPSFSPDGTRIAFERWAGVGADVLVMNADGSGEKRLAASEFQKASDTSWEANYEAENPPATIPFVKVVTTTTTTHSFEAPSFSPDGTQLAVAEILGKYAFSAICAVAGPGDEQCIPEGQPGAFATTSLACVVCTARIVAINSTTGERIGELTSPAPATYDLEPAYSVDGKLAFRHEENSGASALLVVDSPGAVPRQVADASGVSPGAAPDFSPDGTKIAFATDGGVGIVAVTGGPVAVVPVPDPAGGEGSTSSPVFSPDGTRIAFDLGVSPQGTPGEGLYTIGLDGSGMALVSSGGHLPSWAPLVPAPPLPAKAARAKGRKGAVRLNGRGSATIGTVVCGSSPCTFSALPARLEAGKRRCAAAARLPKRLGPEKSAPLKVKVAGKCLAALKRAGRGRLVARLRAADDAGRKLLIVRSTLVPPGMTGGQGRR